LGGLNPSSSEIMVILRPFTPPWSFDHLEVGDLCFGERDEARQRSAIGHGLAELDLAVAGARIVFLLRRGRFAITAPAIRAIDSSTAAALRT